MLNKVRTLLKNQAVRYLFAGGLAFTTEYALFFVLFSLADWQLYLANSLSFASGLVVSFVLNRTWAFRQADFRLRKHHQAAAYVALALCNLLLINGIIGILKHLSVTPLLAKLLAMACIVVWNFFIFRLVIFRSSGATGDR